MCGLDVQSFHNAPLPDCYDAANANFMFNTLPYVFGSGCCFITGAHFLRTRKTCNHMCVCVCASSTIGNTKRCLLLISTSPQRLSSLQTW